MEEQERARGPKLMPLILSRDYKRKNRGFGGTSKLGGPREGWWCFPLCHSLISLLVTWTEAWAECEREEENRALNQWHREEHRGSVGASTLSFVSLLCPQLAKLPQMGHLITKICFFPFKMGTVILLHDSMLWEPSVCAGWKVIVKVPL